MVGDEDHALTNKRLERELQSGRFGQRREDLFGASDAPLGIVANTDPELDKSWLRGGLGVLVAERRTACLDHADVREQRPEIVGDLMPALVPGPGQRGRRQEAASGIRKGVGRAGAVADTDLGPVVGSDDLAR